MEFATIFGFIAAASAAAVTPNNSLNRREDVSFQHPTEHPTTAC